MQSENVFKLFVVFAKVASSHHIILFTLYVDDLIKKLRSSGYGLHYIIIGSLLSVAFCMLTILYYYHHRVLSPKTS